LVGGHIAAHTIFLADIMVYHGITHTRNVYYFC